MTGDEAIVFLEAIKRGLHQTGKDHPYRDDLIPKMKEALCIAIEALKDEPCEDAIRRKFEEIVAEYPPAELCAYPEYRGKPYYSIKYEENGEHFVGFGTYNPEVLTRYLKEYFMVKPQKPYKAENEEAEE